MSQHNIALAVPAPDGKGEIHMLKMGDGKLVDSQSRPTTNRAYFDTRGQLELTATECRRLASDLEMAADQLDSHHDTRMPVEEVDSE